MSICRQGESFGPNHAGGTSGLSGSLSKSPEMTYKVRIPYAHPEVWQPLRIEQAFRNMRASLPLIKPHKRYTQGPGLCASLLRDIQKSISVYLGVWLSDLDRDVNWAMSSFLHSSSCKQMTQCIDSGERQCDVDRSSLLVYIKLKFSGELRGFVEEIGGKEK